MKTQFSRYLIKQLHKRGFFYKRYPTTAYFHKQVKNMPEEIQHYELKKMTSALKRANHHAFYNSLLKKFIPDWAEKTKKQEFTGIGVGESNLNTYRKVFIDGRSYFEKIFFSSGRELEALIWFHSEVYEKIGHIFKIPELKKIYRGEYLTLVYYEFINLSSIPQFQKEQQLIEYSKLLYFASVEQEIKFDEWSLPEFLTNFESVHNIYKKNRSIAQVIPK